MFCGTKTVLAVQERPLIEQTGHCSLKSIGRDERPFGSSSRRNAVLFAKKHRTVQTDSFQLILRETRGLTSIHSFASVGCKVYEWIVDFQQ
jgi:hypothetical protein